MNSETTIADTSKEGLGRGGEGGKGGTTMAQVERSAMIGELQIGRGTAILWHTHTNERGQ